MAQAVYAVRNEMARKLSDIVLRRTGIATLGNPGERVLEEVAVAAGRELGWDGRRIERELKETVKTLEVPTE